MLAIKKPDWLVCEPALRGALAVGREKEEERNADWWTLVMTSLSLTRVFQCLFTFALVSAPRWLAAIWQFSRRGATEELEAGFKFQGRSYKLSFLFPPRRQSAPPGKIARRVDWREKTRLTSPEGRVAATSKAWCYLGKTRFLILNQ